MITLSPGITFYAPSTSPVAGSPGLEGAVFAQATDAAREFLARTLAEGVAFQIKEFSVGTDGYDSSNPKFALEIDPSQTTLGREVFRGPVAIPVERPNETARSFYCRMNPNDANFGLGELALWAKVLSSPTSSEIGTWFIFALAHLPLQVKTSEHTFIYRVVVQL